MKTLPDRGQTLVALSGGVDSAVAAWRLVQAGHSVQAVYMKNWINEAGGPIADCPWEEDIRDARAVAEHLGIPFEVANFVDAYRERIVDYLVAGYAAGATPNPDVLCNREMKFGLLRDYAAKIGCTAVATGHYAQRIEVGGEVQLLEGADPNKDQSYFLCLLEKAQLAAARFPIGDLLKPRVRELARKAGLPNAEKKDSQGICFVGQIRMRDFLRHYIPDTPGEIVDRQGRVRGEHPGLHHFTLGQRKGIGVPSNTDHEHFVVVAKEAETNLLIVDFDSSSDAVLRQTEMALLNTSWLGDPITEEIELEVRVRYRDPRVRARLIPEDDQTRVVFAEPQRAIAPGQFCAIHDGPRVLGGATFANVPVAV